MLHYEYGGENSSVPSRSPAGQRTDMARLIEKQILKRTPGIVLVLMKASAKVIKIRMEQNLYPNRETLQSQHKSKFLGEPTRGVVLKKDVELVLKRFDEEFDASLIQNKIVLNTTNSTVDETFQEFVKKCIRFSANQIVKE